MFILILKPRLISLTFHCLIIKSEQAKSFQIQQPITFRDISLTVQAFTLIKKQTTLKIILNFIISSSLKFFISISLITTIFSLHQ